MFNSVKGEILENEELYQKICEQTNYISDADQRTKNNAFNLVALRVVEELPNKIAEAMIHVEDKKCERVEKMIKNITDEIKSVGDKFVEVINYAAKEAQKKEFKDTVEGLLKRFG